MISGNSTFTVGIIILLISFLSAAVFYPIHIFLSKNTNKQLEKEYGKNPIDIKNKTQ